MHSTQYTPVATFSIILTTNEGDNKFTVIPTQGKAETDVFCQLFQPPNP